MVTILVGHLHDIRLLALIALVRKSFWQIETKLISESPQGFIRLYMAESRIFGYENWAEHNAMVRIMIQNWWFILFYTLALILQPESTSLLRLRIIAGHNLCKKDIFGARYYTLPIYIYCLTLKFKYQYLFSDPYVRIDLVAAEGEEVIDSVLTKTKKRVRVSVTLLLAIFNFKNLILIIRP